MLDPLSRRHVLAGFAALSAVGAGPCLAADPQFDDPFLGRTSQGDLILAPSRTHMVGSPPRKSEFFGVVRKTNVLTAQAAGDKINMLVLFAAFRGDDCHLSLCSMGALERSAETASRRAYEVLEAIGLRLKDRPDSVYEIQDIDKLGATRCAKNASSMVASAATSPGAL
jgi:hypothetical protein